MSPLVSLSKRCVNLHTAEIISSCIAGTAAVSACIETYEHARSQTLVPAQKCQLKAVRWHAAASLSATVCANMRGACCRAPRQKSGRRRRTSMQPGCGTAAQGHETKPRDCARFYQLHRLKWQPQVFFWAEGTLPCGTSRSSATYRPIRFIRQPGASPPRSSTMDRVMSML